MNNGYRRGVRGANNSSAGGANSGGQGGGGGTTIAGHNIRAPLRPILAPISGNLRQIRLNMRLGYMPQSSPGSSNRN